MDTFGDFFRHVNVFEISLLLGVQDRDLTFTHSSLLTLHFHIF